MPTKSRNAAEVHYNGTYNITTFSYASALDVC